MTNSALSTATSPAQDRACRRQLAALGSATVHEAMGRVGLMKPYMRPIYAGAQVSGTAVTVLLQPGDNWMMHVVAEQIQPGDIVVAAITADMHRRLFRRPAGHFSFRPAARARWSSTAVCAMSRRSPRWAFPVWSRAISSKGTVKATAGFSQYPGGVRRAAHHTGRCDRGRRRRRGLCARPWRRRTSGATRAREANEGEKRAKLANGVLGLDMYKMREPLAAAGLKYID
jgi:4-hydroxy-4-methyl-2-oxoglutarate aldolase